MAENGRRLWRHRILLGRRPRSGASRDRESANGQRCDPTTGASGDGESRGSDPPRQTGRGRRFASAEGTCMAGKMGITLPSSFVLYFAQLCVLALDGWYVAYEHEPDLYSMCVLFQRF
jgi:hypothetical protein